ncbi:MAG: hypothetical protein QF811_04995 [Candidatus Woesearchaeota archaeon]|nr:hypothetical protein [Candidatus Woesearchaeota archaeon]
MPTQVRILSPALLPHEEDWMEAFFAKGWTIVGLTEDFCFYHALIEERDSPSYWDFSRKDYILIPDEKDEWNTIETRHRLSRLGFPNPLLRLDKDIPVRGVRFRPGLANFIGLDGFAKLSCAYENLPRLIEGYLHPDIYKLDSNIVTPHAN